MYKITETTAYYPLSVLLRESGLEVEISNNAPEETLKMWKCEDEETGELLAAAVLQYKSYCYVLENLAVTSQRRGTGLGKKLLDIVEQEVKARGAGEIWGCAKVPDYYKQYGWVEVAGDEAPEISHCSTCPQWGKVCFPRFIKKQLEG